jgi:hypothetical protein
MLQHNIAINYDLPFNLAILGNISDFMPENRSDQKFEFTHYSLMDLSPSLESVNFAATQEFASILWNPMVYYHAHKSPPPVPNLSQIDPVNYPIVAF